MRQYKTLIICLFFLSIFCFSKVNALVKDYSLLGKVIYIDPGHPSYLFPNVIGITNKNL